MKPQTENPDRIKKREELNRFCDLQRQFINQLRDKDIQEKMFNALASMELINAE